MRRYSQILISMTCLAFGTAPVCAAELQHPIPMERFSLNSSTRSKTIALPTLAQVNPSESSDADESSNSSNLLTASERSKLMWWLAGVAGVVVLATGFLYLFLKISRPGAMADESPDEFPEAVTDRKLAAIAHSTVNYPQPSQISPTSDRQDRVVEVDLPSQEQLTHRNGTNNGSVPHEPVESLLTLEETTPLAKINIVDALIQDLQNPDPAKRRKAIWELGQRGDSRAIQPLVDLMLDSDSSQRSLILAVLSEIGTRTLKPMNRALAVSLQDDSPEVRKNAIRDLTRIYDVVAQMSQLLNHAIDDSDREVSDTAQWALSQLNRIRALGGRGDLPSLPRASHPSENTSSFD